MNARMKDEGGRKRPGRRRRDRFARLLLGIALVCFLATACTLKASRQGVPAEVESLVATVSDDIEEGRYEKIYNEADDEWRHDSTLEQTNAVFSTLKNKLGKAKNRQLHSATEEHSSNGRLAGHSFVLTYETKFEGGDGMETFTLVERNGHWLLAKYLVNSMALS